VIAAEGITVTYGRRRVLDGVSLSVERGETVGLRGPSGAGKSTLLRVLALLHRPAAGTVSIDGTAITGTGTRSQPPSAPASVCSSKPPRRRRPATVPGRPIAEPLRVARHSRETVTTRVADLADTVGLTADLLGEVARAVARAGS